ncbi:transferrin receptor-like dimerization domain-containing protein [Daejeonella sp.]|uniref:transferrin receptor-like dimerization domain-containing protein n=1 Tax=Daejeonella sp. TaxID=2805397 RepID=UPI0027B976C9|nr:transferrin receptor-like dimerization domain-containing protein [Daejeonella sp.]
MKKYFLSLATILISLGTASAQDQKQLESSFDSHLSSENIGKTIKELSLKPHYLGSPASKEVAENLLAKFKSYGWDAELAVYNVLFPTPKVRLLEMTAPTKYKALLKEPAYKEDATSGHPDQLPTYNAWSADGDVSAELVFVNFGLPEDYETLNKLGIDVKGKIVIARYGRSWRGIKPKVAQEHGAIGCIIYSDPMEDGYFQGDVYPKGSFKNEYGVQRGSIMDMVIYPGDPLTPFIGATENAKRLKKEDAENLLKIPVLPISYHDAQPLLQALGGPVAPSDWRGALPFTYHIGPGKTSVRLKLEFDWKIVPAYNVIAKIKGSEFPDQWIVRGNHHDAWNPGANDPISGVAAMMEEAKSIGELIKNGYKPKRTLVYCAWDAEEPGLIGSTEWVEDHLAELKQKAVVYINSDGNGRGFLSAAGSHALESMIDGIAKDVIDPQTKVSVFDRLKAREVVSAGSDKAKKDNMAKKSMTIGALGSGSDYSSFLQYAGIPSLNIAFGGENPGGEYHTAYDSYDFYSRFGDPGFNYGRALSQTIGRAVLRMADANTLPFEFKNLHKTISSYVAEMINMTDQMRESTAVYNQIISGNNYQLAADPTKTEKLPIRKVEVPFIDFSALQNSLVNLDRSAITLSDRIAKGNISSTSLKALNEALYMAEQKLLTSTGLPRRPWYKHTIYAPGFYTGYGVKTMPGVREAIEQRDWKEAQDQIEIAAKAISRLAEHLNNTTKLAQ